MPLHPVKVNFDKTPDKTPAKREGEVYTSSGVIYVMTPETLAFLHEDDQRWIRMVSEDNLEGAHDLVSQLGGSVLREPTSGTFSVGTVAKWACRQATAQVGTDTATIFAISPEGLQKLVQVAHLTRDWPEWADHMEEIEGLVRAHGGAVFHTGGDGAFAVGVDGSVDEGGHVPPYGTSACGKVASQHQARVVVAHMKQAGWWSLGDEHSGNVLGDGPLDARIEFIEKIDEMYRRTWNRPVSVEELGAVLQVPVWASDSDSVSWPMNRWVDDAAQFMGVPQSVVLMLPEDSLRDARRLWRAHRNSGIQLGVPMPDDGFERTDESLQSFRDHIKASFMFAQREAVEMVDAVDPARLKLAMQYKADQIPADYDRLQTIEKHSMDKQAEMTHAASIALMKWLSVLTKHLGVARHVYVVGGAVRNFLIDQPIKDIDMVVDSIAMGRGKDSEWLAKQVARQIPAKSEIVVDNLMVSKVLIRGSWVLDGHEMEGNDIEIVNARLEEYETDPETGDYVGHKPINVEPTDMETDVTRREFTFNCMVGDTLIPTEKGILRIDEIAARDAGDHQDIRLMVAGQDGPAKAVGWQYSGNAPTLRVQTGWGHDFSCTHHHPVLVLKGHDHEWVQADQLEEGDLLCVPVHQVLRTTPLTLNLSDPVQPKHGRLKEVLKPGEMTPELAFVIGCVVAEGSNTHKRVSFSNSDPKFISRYAECFNAVFGFQPSRNKVVEKGSVRTLRGVDFVANADGYDIYADSKTVVGWLEALGLYCEGSKDGKSASHHKVVPWAILQADERSQCAFLAAYLEGDGSIRPDTGRITFCSSSPHIRQQFQVLLGAHGILSKVKDRFVYINAVDSEALWEKVRPWMVTKEFDYTGRTSKSRNRYGIPVDYIVGFLSGRRQASAGTAGVSYTTDSGESLPLRGMHEPVRRVRRLLHDAHSRGALDDFMSGIKAISPSEHLKLQRLFGLGYQYVEVTSVQDAGEQDVFDISMGEGIEPAFVASGVVVHNTLMWRLVDLADGPDKAEIVDLTGCGLRDLENRQMQCPGDPDDIFAKDPTRIIRIIKFAHKYGFKLTPDTRAAAKRQAKGLKRIPAKAWGALHDIVLESAQYKKALEVMDDLGVIDVLKEMMQQDKQFRVTLSGYTNKRGVAFMFDLMDLGVPVGGSIKFMDSNEQRRFREVTSGMDRDEALEFLAAVKKPGNAVKDDSFQPGLEQQYGITKREKGTFFPMIARVSRALLLDDPLLMKNTNKLKSLIADRVETEMGRQRRASDHVAIPFDAAVYEEVRRFVRRMSITRSMQMTDSKARGSIFFSLAPNQLKDADKLEQAVNREFGDAVETTRKPDFNDEVRVEIHVKPSRRARLIQAWGPTMGNEPQYKAAAVTGTGESVGMFIPLPKELADQFPSLGDNDDSPTHVTLFYGGGVPADRQEEYLDTIKGVLSGFGPIKARLGDVDYFTHVEKQRRVAYVRVWFSRDMGSLRDRLRSAIEDAGFESKDSFPLAYNPHATLAYMDGLDSVYEGPVPSGDWLFDSIPLWGLPQKHNITLRGGSSIRVANAHLGLLPVMDPIFNVRECVKQLILLEDHLFHPRKRCPDCIKKHTLFAEALMEEAVTLDLRGEHPYLPKLAEDIRFMGRAILTMPLHEAAQVARQIRKLMTNQLLGLRALDIERV